METRREMEGTTTYFERPACLGPVPCTGWGPRHDLSAPRTAEEKRADRRSLRRLVPRLRPLLLKISARLNHRRQQLGWLETGDWGPAELQTRTAQDLEALVGVLWTFCGAPATMIEMAVEWATYRRRLKIDEPYYIWDGKTATVGIILAALHRTEEDLLTP